MSDPNEWVKVGLPFDISRGDEFRLDEDGQWWIKKALPQPAPYSPSPEAEALYRKCFVRSTIADAYQAIDAALEAARQQGRDEAREKCEGPLIGKPPHCGDPLCSKVHDGSTVASPLRGIHRMVRDAEARKRGGYRADSEMWCPACELPWELTSHAIPEGKVLVDRELVESTLATLTRCGRSQHTPIIDRLRAALEEADK